MRCANPRWKGGVGGSSLSPHTYRRGIVTHSESPSCAAFAQLNTSAAAAPYSVTISTSTLMPRRRPSGCSSSAMTTV